MLTPRLLSLIFFVILNVLHAGDGTNKFRDVSLPLEQRVDALIGQLTIGEKISQLMMESPAIPRLGIHAYHWWNEGLHGVARNGTATVFPQAIAMAATWDPELIGKVGEAISTEFRAKNNETILKSGGDTKIYQGLTVWSPNINIFRDPRWGRGQETYGEDPFLTGRMGVAFVKGLQGSDPTYLKTVATLKHYAVHSGPEELRHKFDAVVSDRDLHETYLPAFMAGVTEGNAASVMSAYNAIDGIPAPANHYLLTDVLRDQWGFRGAVVGDVDTVGDVFGKYSHHYAKDAAAASALSLKAGNDLCSGKTYSALPEALKQGLVSEADLDRALKRLFTLRFRLGQFDPPELVPYTKIPISENDSPEHSELALQAARESLVLLKNDGTLPWNPKEIRTIAILGPTADDYNMIIGNYAGTPAAPVSILEGLKNELEPLGVKVLYEAAVPLVSGFKEKGQQFTDGMIFTDETLSVKGFKREVFDNPDFHGSPLDTRISRQLDLNWNQYSPMEGIPLQGAHLRWQGVIVPKESGQYVLALTTTGASRLCIDGKVIADVEKSRNMWDDNTADATVRLEAGHSYKMVISYDPDSSWSVGHIALGWKACAGIDKAIELAKKADHVVLTLGISPVLEGEEMKVDAEGFERGDRKSITLPKVQADLLEKVSTLGKPVVVVLTSGSSLSLDVSKANGILQAWYYGQGGGNAVAEALVGKYNPGGRLPITFYHSEKGLPSFTDYSMKNRTYRYFTGRPLYAFGHGLSYTTFTYGSPTLSTDSAKASDTVAVTVDVTNTGKLKGDEVVQIYVHSCYPLVEMPIESLVGFQRVTIAPGETKRISIPVKVNSFRRWDEKANRYVVDPGEYTIRVGSASDEIHSTKTLRVE